MLQDRFGEASSPQPAKWPILQEDAYHGLAGEIVRLIEPETEADPVAILVQLLVFFGNVVGRNAHYVVEGTKHHANLFATLVGSTARGRKGTSEGRVRQVFRLVDETWTSESINTGLSSGEGLIWAVRDPICKYENVKEKGRIVGAEKVLVDPGVSDKRLLVIEAEFASVLRVCKREQNILSPILRCAWDSGDLKTLVKNSPAVATDAHISVVGHITEDELRGALSEVDGFNGFANRFLWLAVRRSKLLPEGGQDLDLVSYSRQLTLIVEQSRAVERMQRDPGAATLWRQVYRELADDGASGLVAAVTSRAEAQVLRLSMVYALLDGSGTIRVEHLRAAIAVWRYCRASAEMIFRNFSGDPLEDRILQLVRKRPGIDREGIHRATGNHVKAKTLDAVLDRLITDQKIYAKLTGTGGRQAKQYYPIGMCEESEESEGRLSDRTLATQQMVLASHTSHTSQAIPTADEINALLDEAAEPATREG